MNGKDKKVFSKTDLQPLLDYARFRGARGERERIVRFIRALARSTDTTFVRWSAQLSALAERIEKQRPRQYSAQETKR